MAYRDFVELYASDMKKTPEEVLAQTPRGFALTSNDRGLALVDMLQRNTSLDFRGKRVLDIGCAYGGISLAFAAAGAKVSAVDVSDRFIDYANANAKGVADIDFHVADASSKKIRQIFKKGEFDFILMNDVLEHIYDTTNLVMNIDYLLNDTGSMYFKVPNGSSPRFALSEGHRKIFGLTLLDPDCWFHLYPKRASIFYRPIQYFAAIFGHFNLTELKYLDEERVFARFTPQKVKRQIKQLYDTAREYPYPNDSVKVYLRHGINKFRDDFMFDVENESDEHVRFKYGSYFYTGVVSRPGVDVTLRGGERVVDGIGVVGHRVELEESEAA